MSRSFNGVLMIVLALFMGFFVEHNFKVINHVQLFCPYLNGCDCCKEGCSCVDCEACNACKCKDCKCCKGCLGRGSDGKCDCEKPCPCCPSCPGKCCPDNIK